MQRQLTEHLETFTDHVPDKRFLSKIDKELQSSMPEQLIKDKVARGGV